MSVEGGVVGMVHENEQKDTKYLGLCGWGGCGTRWDQEWGVWCYAEGYKRTCRLNPVFRRNPAVLGQGMLL